MHTDTSHVEPATHKAYSGYGSLQAVWDKRRADARAIRDEMAASAGGSLNPSTAVAVRNLVEAIDVLNAVFPPEPPPYFPDKPEKPAKKG